MIFGQQLQTTYHVITCMYRNCIPEEIPALNGSVNSSLLILYCEVHVGTLRLNAMYN